MTNETPDYSSYVRGHWRRASGPDLEVLNPASEEIIARLATATPEEVHEALSAAREAQEGWARVPSPVRGAHVRAIAKVVASNRDRLASLIVAEMGKPLQQALSEVDFATSLLAYSAEWDRRLEGEVLPGDVPGEVVHLLRVPVGVVVAICPWNFPLAVLCRKLGPALVTGNTLVVKPSEVSPLSTMELFRLIDQELDFPSGVVNLVTGAAPTGRALVEDPLASMVSFTGHRDTGKGIMRAAAANLTRVALELGGKAPAIVWADADLDLAVPAIVAARHTNARQVCTSAERVFVHADVYEAFVDAYVSSLAKMKLGDPTGDVEMGPLASRAQLDKTVAAVATALDEGAEVVTGGGRPTGEDFQKGYWYAPTVLRGAHRDMAIMREETFGPVTPVIPVRSLAETIELSNDSRYGLSAYIFSRDYQTIMRTVERLDFGEIYINRTLGESVHAHHAGYKESGIGGEDGKWGMLRYTQIKTAYHHYG